MLPPENPIPLSMQRPRLRKRWVHSPSRPTSRSTPPPPNPRGLPGGGVRAAHDQGVFPPGEAVVHLDARVVARRLQPALPARPRRRPPRRRPRPRPQAQRGPKERGAHWDPARPQHGRSASRAQILASHTHSGRGHEAPPTRKGPGHAPPTPEEEVGKRPPRLPRVVRSAPRRRGRGSASGWGRGAAGWGGVPAPGRARAEALRPSPQRGTEQSRCNPGLGTGLRAARSGSRGGHQLPAPRLLAKHVCTPAQHTEQVCTPAQHTVQVCTPAQHTEHVCTPAQHTEHVCTSAHTLSPHERAKLGHHPFIKYA